MVVWEPFLRLDHLPAYAMSAGGASGHPIARVFVLRDGAAGTSIVCASTGDWTAMPRKSPFDVSLSSEERMSLESMARRYTSPYCDVIRAKIILLAAEGLSNDVIAARLDTPRQIVSKWRKRFALARMPGLEAQPRGGRKARFPPSLVVQVNRAILTIHISFPPYLDSARPGIPRRLGLRPSCLPLSWSRLLRGK